MDEKDKEYLEKLYGGFALAGYLMNGDYHPDEIPALAKKMAKAMMQEEIGIVAVKRSSTKKEK